MITVSTLKFEASHGRKPRQPREYAACPWAFQIDSKAEPVFITASYPEALRQAKKLARYSVTVLP